MPMLQDCLKQMYLVVFFLIALIAHTVCLCYGTAGQLLEESIYIAFTALSTLRNTQMMDVLLLASAWCFPKQMSCFNCESHCNRELTCIQWFVPCSGVLQQWTYFNGSNCSCNNMGAHSIVVWKDFDVLCSATEKISNQVLFQTFWSKFEIVQQLYSSLIQLSDL